MNSVVASIVRVSGTSATVSVESTQACPRCAAGKGCGAGLFADNLRQTEIIVELPPEQNFRTGDLVTLSMSSSNLLHVSFLAYGLPLIGGLGLVGLGAIFFGPLSDILSASLAIFGLTAGFLVGRRRVKREHCARDFVPVVSGGSLRS